MTQNKRGLGQASKVILKTILDMLTVFAPYTVRGIAYQLFNVHHLIPSMDKKNVDRVGRLTVTARERGIIDWKAIVDESREIETPSTWDNLEHFSEDIEDAYRKNYWYAQPYAVQVWSEKSTMAGVLRPVTHEYGVPFFAVHGFGSATALHDAAVKSARDRRHQVVILYVGDWDPSGLHMSDIDLPGRLQRYGGRAVVRRVALTKEDLPGLPSFPIEKKGDPRYPWFCARFGEHAWEIDAMNPNVLRARVAAAIEEYINWDIWERTKITEAAEIATVKRVASVMFCPEYEE